MSINHLPCKRRRRRHRPQHHRWHHPRHHRCRHCPTTRQTRQTHSTMTTVQAVLVPVGATDWAASAFHVQVKDAPIRVVVVEESPSPLVVRVEALSMPHISPMEQAVPPQYPVYRRLHYRRTTCRGQTKCTATSSILVKHICPSTRKQVAMHVSSDRKLGCCKID